MSLFDDDFYSPKVSSWERRRIRNESREDGRWPIRRRYWRLGLPNRAVVYALSGALGLAVCLLLLSPLWGARDAATDDGATAGRGAPAAGEPLSVVDIVDKLKPAIVSVISSRSFGGEDDETVDEAELGIGSGIVYRKDGNDGFIVTNHHVIEGASSLQVVLSDGKKLDAKLVGSDALTDLAVLKVNGKDIARAAEFGNSDALKEGEPAIAIGHPYGLGYSPTITTGIISSLHRVIPISLAMDGTIDWEMELLQTDAAINHGNSGGALVNQAGQVIGINSMKVAEAGVEGLGFAIPSNTAAPVIAELEQYGKVRRPYLGVATVDIQDYPQFAENEDEVELPKGVENGIIVLDAFGPAAEAGLRSNDVIVALDDRPIGTTLELRKYLYDHKQIGDPIRVDYYRDGKKSSVTAELGESPEP